MVLPGVVVVMILLAVVVKVRLLLMLVLLLLLLSCWVVAVVGPGGTVDGEVYVGGVVTILRKSGSGYEI
jgi:hypothetical protein